MAWDLLVAFFTKSLTVLTWPPLILLCPLYASVRALESGSHSSNQRCLSFWVLFSMFMIMERELPMLFNWLPWWSHVKAVATILLLIPYFGAASFIYKFLIMHHFTWNLCQRTLNIFSRKSTHSELDEDSESIFESDEDNITPPELEEDTELVEVTDRTVATCEIQEKIHVVYQERDDNHAGCDKTESSYTRLTGRKCVQKEWSCALCLFTASSENYLGAHLQGRKHKAKETELRELLSSKRTKGMVLLSPIGKILNPVSRSTTWHEWKKPESEWTKLNTDGSIQREYAGYGGLLRDHKGEPICAFVSKAFLGDIFLVELWAIWRGLVLSLGLGIKAIWVESDSMSVVKTINREQPSCPKADSYLKQIWKLLRKFDKYDISHSCREANTAADYLSKMVLGGNDVVLWPADFPPSLCRIIEDDASGTIYPRR